MIKGLPEIGGFSLSCGKNTDPKQIQSNPTSVNKPTSHLSSVNKPTSPPTFKPIGYLQTHRETERKIRGRSEIAWTEWTNHAGERAEIGAVLKIGNRRCLEDRLIGWIEMELPTASISISVVAHLTTGASRSLISLLSKSVPPFKKSAITSFLSRNSFNFFSFSGLFKLMFSISGLFKLMFSFSGLFKLMFSISSDLQQGGGITSRKRVNAAAKKSEHVSILMQFDSKQIF